MCSLQPQMGDHERWIFEKWVEDGIGFCGSGPVMVVVTVNKFWA